MTKIKIHLPPYFIKFGKEIYINELRNHGIVYFNPLSFFKKIEDDEVRSDNLEGALRIEQVMDIKVYHEGKIIAHQLPGSKAQLYFHDPQINGKVFSLYSILNDHLAQGFTFDSRLSKFGDKLLLITHTNKFLERIIKQIKINNIKFNLGYVTYYDKSKYSGDLNPFQKPDTFSYQYEFRVFIESSDNFPLKLKIGSLKDISQILDVSKLHSIKLVSGSTLTEEQLRKIKKDLKRKNNSPNT
jgi:hypothetical protein